MLGMMNSPSDSVEFYATNRKVSDEVSVENPELKKFTEVKKKDVVSYTEDGRKMINGKLVTETDAPTLWSSALLRGRIHTITGSPISEKEQKKERENVRRNSKKLGRTIAVVASLQRMESTEVIGQESDVPQPVAITPVTVVGSSSPPE
ncbi:Protein CBG20616 [Caenorhabditis briggsae]|uniref:Uncharacterized protein n=2 Tax=Caenorhabditis briggsae TaxID=6238 RepID=A0AAE9IV83_CAEBR|nr:Protein CBG20616 [Caenorhabditis briggsae]ULU07231.1 hypothetical protein L3Y34_018767 [Caenorhabditis briggsae]UMM19147.1 hypothetical protein L5515_014882 [Caenorhabditis briggsae]CAP37594.1 Protein CBG20616 [Caenorhabditis briggsae]